MYGCCLCGACIIFPERLEIIGDDFLKILYVCNNCIHDIKDKPTKELIAIINERYAAWRGT